MSYDSAYENTKIQEQVPGKSTNSDNIPFWFTDPFSPFLFIFSRKWGILAALFEENLLSIFATNLKYRI